MAGYEHESTPAERRERFTERVKGLEKQMDVLEARRAEVMVDPLASSQQRADAAAQIDNQLAAMRLRADAVKAHRDAIQD